MELKPGYTQTEVGWIPEVWTVVSLGSTARGIYRGASPRPIENPIWFDDTSKVGWVRISDVTRSGRQLVETTQRLSKEGIQKSRFIPSGSLIMSICATVGRPIETQIDVCIHDGFVVFDRPLIDQGYLYHVLKDLEPRWSSKGQTGSQMNLNGDLIKSTLIPLPPTKAEQESIAEALSDTDALIESLDQLIAKKRQIKQGAMQELLTGKRRLPGFSGEWEKLLIEDIADVKTGPFGSALHESDYVQSGTPIITVEHLGEFGVTRQNLPLVSDEDCKRLSAYTLKSGDIVFSRVGSVDRNSLISDSESGWLFSGRLLRVRVDKERVYAPYLSFQFHTQSFKQLVLAVAVGQTMASLNTRILKNISVTLPSLAEQTAIATVLSDMDTELAALESRLAKARQIKQGMMQELLTGRIRLLWIS